MANTSKTTNQDYIKICNIKPDTVQKINNIAKYYSMDRSSFLKMLIQKTIDEYPEHIKKDSED